MNITNPFSYPLKQETKISFSPFSVSFIIIGISAYFLLGMSFFPVWLLSLLPLVIFIGIHFSKRESLLFSVFVLTLTLIQLKPEHGAFTIFDALAGAITFGFIAILFLKKIIYADKYLIGSKEYFFSVLYFLWVAIIGIINIFFANTIVVSWIRDLSLLTPLLIIPPMFLVINLEDKRDRLFFYGTIILTGGICFVVSLVNVRSSFLSATYLFEVGYRGVNLINGPFMAFVFFHLFLSEKQRKKRYYFLFGILISFATIVLVHNRTWWVLTSIGFITTLFFLPRELRIKAYRLFLHLFILAISAGSILYMMFPFFRVLCNFFFTYFLTSSNLRTDPSLVGRYIEWRYVWNAIKESPLTGYGMGGTFHLYSWFGGFFTESAYTHNGYLGVLLKGGIIGFILLFIAYLGFVWKGFSLLRTRLLDKTQLALLRAGLSILLLLLVATNTFNMFAHRDVLLYVGIIWGYFLYIDRTTFSKFRSISTNISLSEKEQ